MMPLSAPNQGYWSISFKTLRTAGLTGARGRTRTGMPVGEAF